jgi:hypothetical protein
MKYSIYNINTGEITETVVFSDSETATANLVGKHYVDGHFDPQTQFVKNNEIKSRTKDPSANGIFYQFDIDSEQWIVSLDMSQQIARDERDLRLSALDRVNVIWFNALSPAQQQQLAQYRQALLDVPQQPGFSEHINWPDKPQWL